MNAAMLLVDALEEGLTLWVENGELRLRAPKGTLMPALRQQLADHRAELIALLEEHKKYAVPSFAQQRLWFLDQLMPGNPSYNLSLATGLSGFLDVPAWTRALNEIVSRHESLRTSLAMIEGHPVQVIAPTLPLGLPVLDLDQGTAEEREARVRELAIVEARRPFDLSSGPLLRASLLRLGAEEHVFLLTQHHIITDGWSMGLFFQELRALYAAFAAGQPSPLPALPLQYADFAAWQRDWLQGKRLEEQLAYWKQTLDGAPPVLELPTDHPRPPILTLRGAYKRFAVPRELAEALDRQSQQEQVTLFVTLLAAFQVLLFRYTGQDDVVVGSPVANRNRSELEGLIGFFVNNVVLRTDLSGNPTFRELLKRTRETSVGAYAHQDLPFEMLVEKLQPERHLNRTPLFQVVFALQNLPLESTKLSGLIMNRIGIDPGVSKFDLMLSMTEGSQGLSGTLEYSTDLFDAATIDRMIDHFKNLLAEVAANPDCRIQDLAFLTQQELDQQLVEWNRTQAAYPRDRCVHELFEAQVEHTPEATALVLGQTHVTYAELNRRANQLAHHLRRLGVGPESLVTVYMERSVEMVVGLLGALKAGGAYMPLDPAYPKDRLEFMLQEVKQAGNGQAPVLLTLDQLAGQLQLDGAQVLRLDTDWQAVAGEPGENLDSGVTPENLAYVLYTSGSTGRPKGTLVLHRGVVNYLTWCQHAYPLAGGQGAPLHSSIAFDLTVTSLFAPLVAGRPVHLLPEGQGPETLGTALRAQQDYSLVKLTPAHLEFLSQQLPPAEAAGRARALIIGGENLLAETLAFWQDHAPGTLLVNEYGPTETVVGCCVYQVPPGERRPGSVPIGRPILNTQLYVLDRQQRPVPVGVPGELYIGGVGLARGYLNRPALTAAAFVPDPFSPEPGARLYRTGDLARWRPDGNLECLGRVDRQVKIRGFRIEPEEVESALLAHPDIAECAVEVVATRERGEARYCTRCVIPSTYPGITFDAEGVCSMCRSFERYKDQAMHYFKPMADLQALLDRARSVKSGQYDCVVLFSGGKDSTYMLYKLVEMGWRVLAFTFDNGYLYEGAKANILRVVSELQVDHVFGSTPCMSQILVDSLNRYSNVCNSCFKAIYTLAVNLAHEKGIGYVITGLSRGQIFETRLMDLLKHDGQLGEEEIDRTVLEARKLYHRMDDAISECLDVSLFQDDAIFEQVQFIDFYRYSDVTQEEILAFLQEHVPWRNPAGTGCTTNCIVNDVGIYVHTRERGFHNYALPASWEVRLGHETREAAMAKLDAQVDDQVVQSILAEIGYHERGNLQGRPGKALAAYYVSSKNPSVSELRAYLAQKLPDYMVPSYLVRLDKMPLTANGKVDRRALPRPDDGARPELGEVFVAPRTPVEEGLAGIWATVLGIEQVGVYDNFFELGGHSLLAIQIASRVRDRFQVELPLKRFFETPTVAGMASEIAPHQGEREQGGGTVLLPRVVPAPDQQYEPFPLTDVQQAYWVGRSRGLELGNIGTHSYGEADYIGLDVARYEWAWQQLIKRHSMLRAIVRPDGQQQILEQVPPYHIEVLDLRGQDPEAVTAQLEAIRRQMSHEILPSAQWPIFSFRATLLDGGVVRLHSSSDALIADAWSWQTISRELTLLYENPAAVLPPLELSFRDYVTTEVAFRKSELYQRSLEYWRNRLKTLAPAPELPLAKSPASLTQPFFVRRSAQMEPETWQRLKSRAARAGLTPSGVLLAAYAAVLAVWSKNPRFTINLTLFNRLPLHPQVDDIVGDFTSLTLLETDLSTQDSFEVQARRVQGQLWEDLDHRYVSGVQVLRDMAAMQGGAPRALMPVVFTSTLVHAGRSQAGPAPSSPEPSPQTSSVLSKGKAIFSLSQTPQVWLDHIVSERRGTLWFRWDAVEELFPEGLLDDLFGAYCQFLERLANEEVAWQEPPRGLVPAPQLEQRAAINATGAPITDDLLHTLFAAQVQQRPQEVAVVTSARSLTYAELARCSTQAGRWLRERAARPNKLVAVVMEKGWEQVAAVLGILNAGAAYLPIDPELPQERIGYLLEYGQVELALTQPWLDQRLAWPEGIQRLVVADQVLAGLDDEPLPPVQSPADLAYVIFTSGSTGQPKGVMIDHRGAVNTILDINQRFQVTPADRVLALSSLSFDLSVYDIFGLLATGGTVVIPDAAARRDPAHWLALMQREQVTLWDSVPALMEMLVEYTEGRSECLPDSLRLVFMSGDWIPLSLPDRIRGLVDGVKIWSGGGATEASIWSILYPIDEVNPDWNSVPYGQPMLNQGFHVLDDKMEDRPLWVPGQLYISGTGLAKGYWRDEEKTRASFIVHSRTGERLYRTGDLGRYLPDGNIEFLGREDSQVKIQGYRIELGEIETALLQHPAVRAGVVTAVGDPRGDKRLVAYVVPEPTAAAPREGSSRTEDGPAIHDYTPSQTETVLLDPLERLRFKLGHPGLRPVDDGAPSIQLTRPEPDVAAYTSRRSYRKFSSQPVPLEQFSRLLSCLLQVELEGIPLAKSLYGSAGSLYPVQTYLYIQPGRVEGLTAGTYYYHPRTHRLVPISADARIDRNLYPPGNREIWDASAFAIFMVAQLNAIRPLYGEWARDFCLLEAGLMTQLLEMSAPAWQIGLCQIGGLNFDSIHHWFDLDEGHVYLHGLLGGAIAVAQTQLQSLVDDSREISSLVTSLQGSPAAEGNTPFPGGPGSGSRAGPDPEGTFLEDLSSFLRGKLPAYMVPSTFIQLKALPLTANGKVDRRALPAPNVEQDRPTGEMAFVAPQTELEQAIAAIWREVLHVEKVSIHDSFFNLGGNSVHLIQVYNKLREGLGIELSIVKMFEYPTIHSLTQHLSQGRDYHPALEQSDARAEARRASRERRRRAKA